MITVTATELRKRIFEYLDMISAGQTIVVIRNNKEVAKMTPTQRRDWQDGMEEKIEIKVPETELIQPLEDIWENHV